MSVIGAGLVLASMVYLSSEMKKQLATQYAENYIKALSTVHAMYSSEVVARIKPLGVEVAHDYQERDGSVPFPATFSIEVADAITEEGSGVSTRLYSDYPFSFRKNGGPRDEFEALALTNLRFVDGRKAAGEKTERFVRMETVDGRPALRYASALYMKQTCVDCHNTHEDSPKTDWKVGDMRGVRAVTLPLDRSFASAQSGWALTLGIMMGITGVGLGVIFLVTNALKASVSALTNTNEAYHRFVPHAFLSYLEKNSILDVQLSDNVEREMTILFSDIRSFTSLSEEMDAEATFDFVNEYLSLMGPVVRKHHGFIDKYIGDAIMALFEHNVDAINAAIEMSAVLTEYNQQRAQNNQAPIDIGIGLNKGCVRLGTVGEDHRMDGTVISDAVNLSSRIEGLTKYYGVRCLMSESVYRAISDPEKYQIRLIGASQVKGKKKSVMVYELFDGDPPEMREKKAHASRRSSKAIGYFQVGELERAKALFKECLKEWPEDVVAQRYVSNCDRYLASNATAN